MTDLKTRGEVGGDNGGWEEEGLSRNMYKGHMDKAKEGKFKDGRQGWVGCQAVVG